jgi:hypothetical protein
MEAPYRLVPCDGLCGNYFHFDMADARKILKPNGDILPHPEMYCKACRDYLQSLDEAMIFFIHLKQKFLGNSAQPDGTA